MVDEVFLFRSISNAVSFSWFVAGVTLEIFFDLKAAIPPAVNNAELTIPYRLAERSVAKARTNNE